jgi:hypothetical protein
MARKILVSLVSDQTIPNVELIKEFDDIDKYWFISTEKMRNQLQWIIDSTNIKNYEIKEVNPFDPNDIEIKLKEIDFGDDEIILNSTGGTKLMSLVATDFFKNLGSTIYYVTGHNKTYLKVYPNRGKKNFLLKSKLSLKEYLTAYGFSYEETKTFKDVKVSENIFNYYLSIDKDTAYSIFNPIRLHRKKKMIVENQTHKNFLEKIQYQYENILSEKDTKYLSGEWLEEYVYYKIKDDLNLADNEIATGINIKKDNTVNELDVIFIFNHKLYIIECKTSIYDKRKIEIIKNGEKKEKDKDINLLSEIIYKSDALRSKFGLFANTYILTLEEIKNEDGTPKQNLSEHFKRAELSRIKIISRQDLIKEKSIKNILNIN